MLDESPFLSQSIEPSHSEHQGITSEQINTGKEVLIKIVSEEADLYERKKLIEILIEGVIPIHLLIKFDPRFLDFIDKYPIVLIYFAQKLSEKLVTQKLSETNLTIEEEFKLTSAANRAKFPFEMGEYKD